MKQTAPTDFINGNVTYDNEGQFFWISDPKLGGIRLLASLRGWGHIQNMPQFKGNLQEAAKFQDSVGEFVAEAINKKVSASNELASHKAELREELDTLLMEVSQVFDGWHSDGTAWSDYDEQVRQRVTKFREKHTFQKLEDNPTEK